MINRHLLRNWVFWGFGIALLFFLVFPVLLPEYIVILITQSLIFAMAAISLDILLGYLGLAVLGHMGYFAVGAYVSGILAVRYQFDIASCIALSICVSALVAGGLGSCLACSRGVFRPDHLGLCPVQMGPCHPMGLPDGWLQWRRGDP